MAELAEAIDEGPGNLMTKAKPQAVDQLETAESLRAMLNDDGVRDNPHALARVARWLRELR